MTTNNPAEDALNRAKSFINDNKDKIDAALQSDKAEEISDNVLDKLAGAAKKVVPGEHAAKVDEIRDNLDKKIGNE
ncbi:hypothetical protein [Microbacterium sp. YY-01]|uniref:hypothetical protein n=1 Tax=Microbacterium sp. YY-01 TaxID=3421634 RepID=UPI003D183EF9